MVVHALDDEARRGTTLRHRSEQPLVQQEAIVLVIQARRQIDAPVFGRPVDRHGTADRFRARRPLPVERAFETHAEHPEVPGIVSGLNRSGRRRKPIAQRDLELAAAGSLGDVPHQTQLQRLGQPASNLIDGVGLLRHVAQRVVSPSQSPLADEQDRRFSST
jgi:hypothetical protein